MRKRQVLKHLVHFAQVLGSLQDLTTSQRSTVVRALGRLAAQLGMKSMLVQKSQDRRGYWRME